MIIIKVETREAQHNILKKEKEKEKEKENIKKQSLNTEHFYCNPKGCGFDFFCFVLFCFVLFLLFQTQISPELTNRF